MNNTQNYFTENASAIDACKQYVGSYIDHLNLAKEQMERILEKEFKDPLRKKIYAAIETPEAGLFLVKSFNGRKTLLNQLIDRAVAHFFPELPCENSYVLLSSEIEETEYETLQAVISLLQELAEALKEIFTIQIIAENKTIVILIDVVE